MRGLWTKIEELSSAPFILLVGLVGGVLQGVPHFFIRISDSTNGRIVQMVLFDVFSVLWWAAALLLWWVAVRRRQFSVWSTAWHLTLALVLADVLGLSLGYVDASIQTNGAFLEAFARAPLSFSTSGFIVVLIRCPIRFLGSTLVVFLGRRLPGHANPVAPRPSMSTDPGAVI
jgi:hypothetical protein